MTDPQKLIRDMQSLDCNALSNDRKTRSELLAASQALCSRLETPWDTILRMITIEPKPSRASSCSDSDRLKLENAATCSQLASTLDLESSFVERLCRHLVAAHIFVCHYATGKFTLTPLATELGTSDSGMSGAITFMLEVYFPVFARIPALLRQQRYTAQNGLFKEASGTDQSLYDFLGANPERSEQFFGMVTGYAATRQKWTDVYSTNSLLEPHASTAPSSEVAFVDVGGGNGHDIVELLAKHPSLASRLVLQDLPDVLATSDVPDGVGKVAHDFFTPQPLRNARAYFLHSVLHNYNDNDAVKVLQMLKPALKRGWSRVLIMDVVIPEENPGLLACSLDMRMLWNFGSGERSERQWRNVIEKARLSVKKIWWPAWEGACVIECILEE
ncbi:MAG: hypothetical protein Q9159_001755 [Coniocarpon cinnabarinum]